MKKKKKEREKKIETCPDFECDNHRRQMKKMMIKKSEKKTKTYNDCDNRRRFLNL